MATFAVVAEGKRCTVKVTPLQPLSAVVDQAREKLSLAGQAAVLKHGNTVLDLNTPVRFANIPAGAKLELDTGSSQRLGISAQAQAGRSSSGSHIQALDQPHSSTPAPMHAQVARAPATQLAAAPDGAPQILGAAGPSSLDEPMRQSSADAELVGAQQHVAASSSGAASLSPSVLHPAHAEQLSQQHAPAAVLQQHGGPSASPSLPGSTPHAQQGLTGPGPPQQRAASAVQPAAVPQAIPEQRNLKVFSRVKAEEQEAASASHAEAELPPEFYEFTAEDYQRVVSGHAAAKHSAAQKTLKTGAMRAAEVLEAASKLGPVLMRIYFPDDVVVQAEFNATDPLSRLKEAVQQWLVPGLKGWQLFTTPPKQVMRDWGLSFYEAHLVPAAHVHFTLGPTSSHAGPCLQPQVLALMAEPPPKTVQQPHAVNGGQQGISGRQQGAGLLSGNESASRGVSASTGASNAGGKKPKWMKIGK